MSGKEAGGPPRGLDPTELPDAGLPEPEPAAPASEDEATDLTGAGAAGEDPGEEDTGEEDATDLHPAPLLGADRPAPSEAPEPAGLPSLPEPESTPEAGAAADDVEATADPSPPDDLEEPEAAAGTAWPRVDALFAGELPPPPVEAGPRIRRLQRTLAVAIPLDVLGVCCWTGVPGAALTLYAWLLADGEVARVEAGEYTTEDAAQLMRLRTISAWTLGFCVVSLVLQIVLFNSTLYGLFYDRLIDAGVRLLGL